jgi:hypothetical protein
LNRQAHTSTLKELGLAGIAKSRKCAERSAFSASVWANDKRERTEKQRCVAQRSEILEFDRIKHKCRLTYEA